MTPAPVSQIAPHIVVVDDEEDLREPVAAYLREQGMDVDEAGGGADLDVILARGVPTLVVLDVTMPDEDGFSIARRLRAMHGNIGIVMLTARRDVIDRVVGLELGADDYIMKPFEPRELLARIRSVLRRLAAAAPAPAATDEDEDEDGDAVAVPFRGTYQEEFWIPTTRGQIRVPVDTIEWIEAAKDYALLHTPERSHMIRITMGALEQGLDPVQMIRVHRSAFVRPGSVLRISAIGRHMVLELRSGAVVRVGPRHWGEVRHRLKV
ncbi:MAG: Two-component system response regulator OmpR [Sphingomonas bacterium]|uniref:response regulator n=1 Tax=Sphingomonas bacterium TaxID=1895847 RepID=UPI0026147EB3|nr:response regulator [Sphingomonas bacterium]MDB5704168.1 Two-component system response regulator OmpR [Sphingomonas bacterium]